MVNAADFKAETLSPGAWFTIFGQNLGSAGQWSSPNTLTLGGAAVSVCGTPAAISYNSGPQINALTPDGVAGQTSCPIVVTVNGLASQAVKVNIAAGVMELFGFTSMVGALPIVTHADYSLVGPVSASLTPARPDETLIAWGTGDCTTPLITVGAAGAKVIFSGRAGPGLCQINFAVPEGLSWANPLKISTSTVS